MESRWRAKRDDSCERCPFGAAHRLQLAEPNAAGLIIVRDAFQRPMQIDRLTIAGLAKERDHALSLAERIDADEMRAVGKQSNRIQQFCDLTIGIAVTKPAARRSLR
jgi:hypothetical protein